MNKKQYQQGSIHLVIILVLVVALLGALGFVFYQNFMVAKTGTATPVVVDETPVVVDSTKYFAITQWGIKGEYSGRGLKYEIVNNSAQLSSDVVAECATRILKEISKYSASDIIIGHGHLAISEPKSAIDLYNSNYFGPDMRKIGNNYYVLEQGVTDACSNDSAIQSVETQSLLDISRFFLTLREQ